MSVIVGVSAKGAPGVSLGVWGLMHCWPRPAVGLEADVSGGSWAVRHGLTCDPGLSDLAATTGPVTDEAISRASLDLNVDGGVARRVVCAPPEGVQVRRALEWLSDRFEAWPDEIDLLADVGRLDIAHGHPLLARADAVVVWTATTPVALSATASILSALGLRIRAGVPVRIVTVGSTPYGPMDAVEALAELAGPRLDVGLGAAVPADARLAGVLEAGGRRAGKVCVSWFGRLAADLAAATAHRSTAPGAVSLGGAVRGAA